MHFKKINNVVFGFKLNIGTKINIKFSMSLSLIVSIKVTVKYSSLEISIIMKSLCGKIFSSSWVID